MNNRSSRCSNFLFYLRVCLPILAFLSPPNQVFADQSSLEYKVKAAYLYNFANFITWPASNVASKNDSMHVCIYGDDPFGQTIEPLETKKAHGYTISILRLKEKLQLSDCQIVFISASEEENLLQILDLLENQSILTVSDYISFAEIGGMIGFIVEQGKVRIEINLSATKQANLKLSAMLLEVARKIW